MYIRVSFYTNNIQMCNNDYSLNTNFVINVTIKKIQMVELETFYDFYLNFHFLWSQ